MEIQIQGSAYNDSTHEAIAVQANQITVDTGVTNENDGANVTISAGVAGYFDYGKLTWLTGQNAGVQADVLAWHGTSLLDLLLPTGNPIQVGDTFTITPGCDKHIATCFAKFNLGTCGSRVPGDTKFATHTSAFESSARPRGLVPTLIVCVSSGLLAGNRVTVSDVVSLTETRY
jgi:Phage conserved hypothetical protein BR0599